MFCIASFNIVNYNMLFILNCWILIGRNLVFLCIVQFNYPLKFYLNLAAFQRDDTVNVASDIRPLKEQHDVEGRVDFKGCAYHEHLIESLGNLFYYQRQEKAILR